MRIDNLPKKDYMWWEDEKGNKVKHKSNKMKSEHNIFLEIEYSVCTKSNVPVWIIKILESISKKIGKWACVPEETVYKITNGKLKCGHLDHHRSSEILSVVRYLVESRNFYFAQAVIMVSQMCCHCLDACEQEINKSSTGLQMPQDFYKHCEYCKYINQEYEERYKDHWENKI